MLDGVSKEINVAGSQKEQKDVNKKKKNKKLSLLILPEATPREIIK